jgi:hypothetical protein
MTKDKKSTGYLAAPLNGHRELPSPGQAVLPSSYVEVYVISSTICMYSVNCNNLFTFLKLKN